MTVTKSIAWVRVPHELLVDSDPTHVCDESCPPPYVPPAIPLRRRLRYFLRRRWWAVKRLPGYRLVHRDDTGRDG